MQLIITALGDAKSRWFERLIAGIHECDCYIKESRMTRLGSGGACFALVEGNWNHIARLENLLTGLKQHGQYFFHRLTEDKKTGQDDALLYVADVVARDRPDVLEELVTFFNHQKVGIQDLRSSCYQLPYLEANMCTIHFLLRIPPEVSVISLRDEFLDVCEQVQIDAIFEPVKPIY